MDGVIEFVDGEVESSRDETLPVEFPAFEAFRGLRESPRGWASVLRDAIEKRSSLVATSLGVGAIAVYGRSLSARLQPLGTSDVITAGIVVTGIIALTALYCYMNGAYHARDNEENDPP